MLNNHMQSIVAYFSKPTDSKPSDSKLVDREPQSESTLRTQSHRPLSHLEPAIAYLAQSQLTGKSERKQFERKQFERKQSEPVRPTANPAHRLRQLWQNLLKIQSDPQIREGMTPSGETYWRVYDPISQVSRTFYEEENVYRWLERRYYE